METQELLHCIQHSNIFLNCEIIGAKVMLFVSEALVK
jgi:hypothetical protein